MASQNGHTTTVDVLLRQGADPNIASNVRKLQSSVLTMYLSIYTHNVLTVITQTRPELLSVMTTITVECLPPMYMQYVASS